VEKEVKCKKIAECKEKVSENYFKSRCMRNPAECVSNFKFPKEWQERKNDNPSS